MYTCLANGLIYCATKHKEFEEKRSYPNLTYGMTTQKKPAIDTATQLHSQEEGNGQTHNAPNRGDDQGR